MKSVIKSAKTVEEAVELGLKDLELSRNEVIIEVLEEAKSGFLGIFGSKDAIVKISQKEDFKIDINDIYGEKKEAEEKARVQEEKRLEAEKKAEIERKAKKEEVKKTRDSEEIEAKSHEYAELTGEKDAFSTKKQVNTKIKEEELSKDSDGKNLDNTEAKIQVRNHGLLSIDELAIESQKNLEDILKSMHIKASVEVDIDENSINYNLVDISEEDTGIIIGRKGETLDSLQYILNLLTNKQSQEFFRVTIDVANYRNRRKEAIENNARKLAFKVIKNKKSIALDPMNSYERRIVHYALQRYKEVETVSQGSFPNRKVIIKYKD